MLSDIKTWEEKMKISHEAKTMKIEVMIVSHIHLVDILIKKIIDSVDNLFCYLFLTDTNIIFGSLFRQN